MTQPQKVLSMLQQEFDTNPLVIAFVLVGSQARETVYQATKYSDMEAYVITKDQNADQLERLLPALVAKTGTILFSFRHAIGFVAVYDDLFRLELPVIKESGLEGLFNRPTAQVVKVLIDKTQGKLDQILAKRPAEIDFQSLFADKITNFWYWQILAVQYFKKGEIYNSRAVLGIHNSTLIWLFELLNDPKILLLETNKRIEGFLNPQQLAVIKDLSPAYDPREIKDKLTKIMDIVFQTAQEIKNKYGYDYNQTLEPSVKSKILELLKD